MRKHFLAILAVFTLSLLFSLVPQNEVAANGGFNAGRIIDDAIFTNANSMSSTDIQNFFNSRNSVCLKNHTTQEPLGNNKYGGTVSAAHAIWKAGQLFGINPQVLLATLEKEQGLITRKDCPQWRYQTALGYGCPDTAPCSTFGFSVQLYQGARHFRGFFDQNAGWYIPYTPGVRYIQYNPNPACGGSNVNIQNRATASLYSYTPYQPNPATLAVPIGQTAHCGAYGNKNFWHYFRTWFGSPIGPDYAWSVKDIAVYSDKERTQLAGKIGNEISLAPNQTAHVRVVVNNIGRASWSKNTTRLGTVSPYDRSSPFRGDDWMSSHRLVSINEQSVQPNKSAAFDFQIKAPLQKKSYTESYRVLKEGVTWFNNASLNIPINVTSPPPSTSLNKDNILKTGSTLYRGKTIMSPEKHSVLKFQNNGNLELFVNFKRVWQSNTSGTNADKLINQDDGNIVLYRDNTPVWSTRSAGSGASSFVLQSDGNLVLYSANGAVWASGTSTFNQIDLVNRRTFGTATIYPNQSLSTADRKYRLVLQEDGNLVLYTTGGPVWASNTYGKTPEVLSMQNDGNLVLYAKGGAPIWSTGTHGRGVSSLVLQDDRNLVIYSPGGVSWDSKTRKR